ncbi:TPA: beta-hydroxyacyl-ACP dehydratase [Candidatus Woesearchaeota archaeon]|nr:beta-hydroxyacyl-ACP dehydratase [Candidatus Woesearchaeota archaeon]
MQSIDNLKKSDGSLDKEAIRKIIPYDEPFLFIDRVTMLDKKKLVAEKTVSPNESYFKGHFRGFPIMPGALIVEGMGQAATLLVRYNLDNHETKDVLAHKIKDARFKAPTFPGAKLTFEIELVGMDEKGAMLNASASHSGIRAAEATIMLAIVDRREFRSKFSKAK